MWFETLTGFAEESPDQVREHISIVGNKLISSVNNQSFQWGSLEIPTLADLKKQADALPSAIGKLKVREKVGDVQQLHTLPENKHALFQAASQFNVLEMVSPSVTPEQGIGRYEYDRTQGPACAIACGAGTIYRNYFVEVNGQIGQTANNQIDCLDEIGKALGNTDQALWKMTNGYAFPSLEGLKTINAHISNLSDAEREALKGKLKIGIQWDTEVTLHGNGQLVSQAYCSALPVAYSTIESHRWGPLARLILEATYEATLIAGQINFTKTGSNRVFLTLVGGGAFGNDFYWIADAMEQAFLKMAHSGLDVQIVSYGNSNQQVQAMIQGLS